jgi:hypothetical protein
MKRIVIGLFSCLSRALNVLRGGHPDMTLSAAAYGEDLAIRKWIDWFFFVVFGEINHCERWFWADYDLALRTIEKAHNRNRSTKQEETLCASLRLPKVSSLKNPTPS